MLVHVGNNETKRDVGADKEKIKNPKDYYLLNGLHIEILFSDKYDKYR